MYHFSHIILDNILFCEYTVIRVKCGVLPAWAIGALCFAATPDFFFYSKIFYCFWDFDRITLDNIFAFV